MKKVVCIKDYKSSFFNLVDEVVHAQKGDLITITNTDFTYTYCVNERTKKRFWLPNIVVDRFFEEVK